TTRSPRRGRAWCRCRRSCARSPTGSWRGGEIGGPCSSLPGQPAKLVDTVEQDPHSTRVTPGDTGSGKILQERFEILRQVGQGGMGRVYLANDQKLDRQVAIKEILIGPDTDEAKLEALRQRFRNEYRAASKVHPWIATIFDVFESDGYEYIVMEYLPDSLARRLKEQGALPWKETLGIARQIASALDYAHGESIIHRDVTPGNILLTAQGDAKL